MSRVINNIAVNKFTSVYVSGVKGQVFDSSGHAVRDAIVEVEGRTNLCPFRTDRHGEYYRLLLPGNYSFTVKKNHSICGMLPSSGRITSLLLHSIFFIDRLGILVTRF